MKIFQIVGLLFLLFPAIAGKAFSQAILYKKDSSVLKVNIKDFDGKTVVYRIYPDSIGNTYHLSKSMLDSLRFSDGKSLNFINTTDIKQFTPPQVAKNYLSVEIINSLIGKVNLDYERIFKSGRISFVLGLLFNLKEKKYNYWVDSYWEEHHYIFQYTTFSPHNYFARIGINFYPFNNSLSRTGRFRLSSGFSLLMGSYREIDYGNASLKSALATSFMWNLKEKLYLSDHFQITGGAEISLIPILTFICPEVGLSIAF